MADGTDDMREKNASERKPETRKEDILKVSYELFIENGYEKTSMRQIAAKAGVSLGLASYHFKGKREIAAEILKRKFASFSHTAGEYVNIKEEPLLYSALLVCLNYTVMSSEKFCSFYRDALREDIYLEVIIQSGNMTYMNIRNRYQPELDDKKAEGMGWYGNYISASMERTLVLYGKDRVMLPGTIPELIFKSYIELWHFPGIEEVVESACRESVRIAEKILSEHPELYD